MSAFGGLDRIDIADDVSDRHIGRGKFFNETVLAVHPVDLCLICVQLYLLPSVCAQWCERIVIDLGTRDYRDLVVKKVCQPTDDARLCLSTQTEKYEIVFREDGIYDLRHNRFIVAEYSGKESLATAQFPYEVRAHLVLDCPRDVSACF